MTREELPLRLPTGWDFDTLVGGQDDRGTKPADMTGADQAQEMDLPQTATNYAVPIVQGAALMLIGLAGLAATRRGTAPLPWLDIQAYAVHAGTRFELICLIAPDAPLPEKVARRLRIMIDAKHRRLVMHCYGIRDMRPQEFSDLIGRYLQAAAARAELSGGAPGADESEPSDGLGL